MAEARPQQQPRRRTFVSMTVPVSASRAFFPSTTTCGHRGSGIKPHSAQRVVNIDG